MKPHPDSAPASEPSSSVAKACRILRALTHLEQTRLTDIAQATGLGKATVSSLVADLAEDDWFVDVGAGRCSRDRAWISSRGSAWAYAKC